MSDVPPHYPPAGDPWSPQGEAQQPVFGEQPAYVPGAYLPGAAPVFQHGTSAYPTQPDAGYPTAGYQAPGYQPPFNPYGQPPVPQSNGFAITALITGLLGVTPFGLIFGFLGLSRAKKVGSGKAMSWIGIVAAVIWIVVQTVFIIAVTDDVKTDLKVNSAATAPAPTLPATPVPTPTASTPAAATLDPGCVELINLDKPAQAFQKDAKSLTKVKADLRDLIAVLNKATKEATDPAVNTQLTHLASDYKALLSALTHGKAPTNAVTNKLATDTTKVLTVCGMN
jgi:hypothetical protein